MPRVGRCDFLRWYARQLRGLSRSLRWCARELRWAQTSARKDVRALLAANKFRDLTIDAG
jgi:hypothetical protein